MYNPQTKGTTDRTESIDVFKGLDLNERISSGYLKWTENCSSRRYPTLSARYERGLIDDLNILCMCTLGDSFYYLTREGEIYELGQSLPIHEFETLDDPQDPFFVTMGSYIILFPYGYYYNTAFPPGGFETDEGFIRVGFNDDINAEELSVQYTMCNSQGDGIDAAIADHDLGADPDDPDYDADFHTDGFYWIDTGGDPHVLKRWSATYESWTQIPNTFTKIACIGIGERFNEMDAVAIYGSTIIPNETYTIYHKDDDYIVVPYLLEEVTPSPVTEIISVERNFPRMDYVVECDNRLWGCRYGLEAGEMLNEIYACALGDFKNWNRFLGLSTDSYVASRGCDGPWTGAVTYLGNPTFFKENHIEVVYPSNTGAHQIQTLHVNGTGVAEMSSKSVVIVDNVVYYHGIFGFYAYTGGAPRKISEALGDNYFSNAVAGELNGVYYVCANYGDDRHLFTYDTNKGIWMHEDEIDIRNFCRSYNDLYFSTYCGLDPESSSWSYVQGKFYAVRGTVGTKSPVEWSAITHDFAIDYYKPSRGAPSKYTDTNAQKVAVRAHVTAGRVLDIYISYDSSYEWKKVGSIVGDGVSRYTDFPIVPARCDHFRLKFKCNGDGCIWNVITRFDKDD